MKRIETRLEEIETIDPLSDRIGPLHNRIAAETNLLVKLNDREEHSSVPTQGNLFLTKN